MLLSQPNDAHIPPVQEALTRMGANVVYCDLADFPEQIKLAAHITSEHTWRGSLVIKNQSQHFNVEDIQSVWWRRPQNSRARQDYSPAVRALLDQEAYRGFLGLLLGAPTLHQPFWVSDPNAIRSAEFKPAQLAAAQALGLHVPRTLLTNNPLAVREFYDTCRGDMIIKAVWRGILDPHGEYVSGQPRFIYTSGVRQEHLSMLDGVQATAHLFQERVEKTLELRVVVIGHRLFAVEIYSQHAEASHLDWRQSYKNLRYGVHRLPDDLQAKLFQLVRLFNLQYASMDIILTPEGEYIWLEANPNGQFFWLEPQTGLPMAETMAQLLCSPKEFGLW